MEKEALMFFILSKSVAFFLLPSNFLIALVVFGVVLMATRFKRAGRWFAMTGIALMVIGGFSPLGVMLAHKLENRFPPWDPSHGAPDGVVVLGGAISPQLSRDWGETAVGGDAGRVIAIAKLARAYPNARIVYSSGDSSLLGNGMAEADFLYPLLDSFGIPRDRVTLESKSRNTVENALLSRDMMKPKPGERWLLVTSAQHMPRAVGTFRQAGFDVEAYPVAWHTRKRLGLYPMDILSNGLGRLDSATHEWIGLIAYWLTGKTAELLPGPAAAK